VASPCALGLSIPSAIFVAIAVGARNGFLFRGGVAIENLADVSQLAFDKTGTLTKGSLVVTKIDILAAQSDNFDPGNFSWSHFRNPKHQLPINLLPRLPNY